MLLLMVDVLFHICVYPFLYVSRTSTPILLLFAWHFMNMYTVTLVCDVMLLDPQQAGVDKRKEHSTHLCRDVCRGVNIPLLNFTHFVFSCVFRLPVVMVDMFSFVVD